MGSHRRSVGALAQPLVRRRLRPDPSALVEALTRFDERVLGEELLVLVRDSAAASPGGWKDPARVADMCTLVTALYAARRLQRQQYVYFAAMPVSSLVDERALTGAYDVDLEPITAQMRLIEEAEGLNVNAGEFWPVGKGPKEYERLNALYEGILDMKYIEALDEFRLSDLAKLKSDDPREFDRLMERGRRSIFDRDERAALRDLVVRCEIEAHRAASAGAFLSAVISLGSGVEGLLTLRCLRAPRRAESLARSLPRADRPRQPGDPATWTFDQLIKVCLAARWLPPVEGSVGIYSPLGLADLLRTMRNNVHPGRQARDRPWVEVDEREYEDADAIYRIVLCALGISRKAQSRAGG